MENASKALLIAAGMIIAGLILIALVFVWKNYSEFYNTKNTFEDIADIAKFNSQLEEYDRKEVYGHELISLANRVINYNYIATSENGGEEIENDQRYSTVSLVINMGEEGKIKKLTYDDRIRIFINNKIEQSMIEKGNKSKNGMLNLIKDTEEFEENVGGPNKAVLLAKSIDALDRDKVTQSLTNGNCNSYIDVTEDGVKDAINKSISDKYYAITNIKYDENSIEKNADRIQKVLFEEKKDALYKYYEYYQFKKGIFKCTNVQYNNSTGRIKEIDFEFTGKIE